MEELTQEFEKRTIQDVTVFRKEILVIAKWYKDIDYLECKKNAQFYLELHQRNGDEDSLLNYEIIERSSSSDAYFIRKAGDTIGDRYYGESNFTRGRIQNYAWKLADELANIGL